MDKQDSIRCKIKDICQDVLLGKIKNIQELEKVWPKNITEEFFEEIFGDITEYFVHLDYTNNFPQKDSWEYLSLYVASKILEHKKDAEILKRCYDKVLDYNDISDVEIDRRIEECLSGECI
ncbi:MAG: hypothetical protein AB1422_10935 [bacterium]